MIKLCVIKRDKSFLVITDDFRALASSLAHAIELMGHLGVEPEEVRQAAHYLFTQDDDYAEFGINRTFIFTDKFKVSA